jgi:hypothetical protein
MASFENLMSRFGSFLGGQPEEQQLLSPYSPENEQSFDELIQSILGRFQQGDDFSGGFEPFANKARSQFQNQTVPSIAERFTRMGGTRSSGFANTLGEAGAGMETDLAAQGAQFGQNQQQLMQRLLGLGQQKKVVRPETHGFIGNLAKPVGKAIGEGISGGVSSGVSGGVGMAGDGLRALGEMLGWIKKK